MSIPFVINNQSHCLAVALNDLLAQSVGKPLDIATAYFAISRYRLVKEGLHQVGAFRLLLGSEPHSGADVGLRPNAEVLKKQLQGDPEAEPFNEATVKLVEELIAFLGTEKVEVRLYDGGFLHAKAYLFHQDNIGPHNRADRLQPFAAIVGSSNFTGPSLVSNKELNLVHRVILPTEKTQDHEAATRLEYLYHAHGLQPVGTDEHRFIKSEVGAKRDNGSVSGMLWRGATARICCTLRWPHCTVRAVAWCYLVRQIAQLLCQSRVSLASTEAIGGVSGGRPGLVRLFYPHLGLRNQRPEVQLAYRNE
jgi:hypothetical protein